MEKLLGKYSIWICTSPASAPYIAIWYVDRLLWHWLISIPHSDFKSLNIKPSDKYQLCKIHNFDCLILDIIKYCPDTKENIHHWLPLISINRPTRLLYSMRGYNLSLSTQSTRIQRHWIKFCALTSSGHPLFYQTH